jgi:hypothetical protein
MASFPELWPHRPSDSSEGFGSFRHSLVTAAFVRAAHVIAPALSELATQGNRAVTARLGHSTGARVAAHPAGASAAFEWGGSRG